MKVFFWVDCSLDKMLLHMLHKGFCMEHMYARVSLTTFNPSSRDTKRKCDLWSDIGCSKKLYLLLLLIKILSHFEVKKPTNKTLKIVSTPFKQLTISLKQTTKLMRQFICKYI